MNPFRDGVDRRQASFGRWGALLKRELIVRMADFHSLKAQTDLTKATYTPTWDKLEFLMSREMEKTQGQQTTGILDANQMAPASALSHLNADDGAFDKDGLSRPRLSNRREPCPIFITQGKMEQEVLNGMEIDPFKFLGGFCPYPSKRGDRLTKK